MAMPGKSARSGDVLRDQLFFMARSGFDAFELRADRSLEDALEAFDDFSESYHPPPISHCRCTGAGGRRFNEE
jgi:uncharacterized protein (DUF934 family)